MSETDASAAALTAALTTGAALPADAADAVLVGRVWDPRVAGPSPVVVRGDEVIDVSRAFATVSELCELDDPAAAASAATGPLIGTVGELLDATRLGDADRPRLLAPVDLQALKAAGVTFAASMLERVIEERAGGDRAKADAVRDTITAEVGAELGRIRPGSPEAATLKAALQSRGLWSQYLEVGLGPDAEIFTKGQPLSAVGTGSEVGVLAASEWNNPEPELALVVASTGRPVGAALANDVNLRDIEGRSALLLPKAKDNNASCAVGPFVRLFDARFGLDAVRGITVRLRVDGEDGFHLDDASHMRLISRDPLELAAQLVGPQHQYPDGAVLLLGTMFAPTADRGAPGLGFTHHPGDVVRISAPELGTLANTVRHSEDCAPFGFGIRALMTSLAARGLLA